ncbi:MAG: NADH-quinone oxidoreductase subunit C [Candidatus Hodarchaeales archaeon]
MASSIEQEIIDKISSQFGLKVDFQRERRLWLEIEPDKLVDVCKFCNQIGFDHLSTINVTDWLDDGKFAVSYHLWSYEKKVLLSITARITRDDPDIQSVNEIWGGNAESCEREQHEMFGVRFLGNSDLTSLFLEDWEGPPPFRKDFNWREYVRETFYDKENPREWSYFEE